jgi:hypothetical protein
MLSYILIYIKYFIIIKTRLFLKACMKLPHALVITILQKIKIFPFLIFGYTYKKFHTVITEELMHNLKEEIDKKRDDDKVK